MASRGQPWTRALPWPALACFGYPGPGLYPGQPWFTLVTLDQGYTLASPGLLWLLWTRALPWPALACFGYSGPGLYPGQPWLALVTLDQGPAMVSLGLLWLPWSRATDCPPVL